MGGGGGGGGVGGGANRHHTGRGLTLKIKSDLPHRMFYDAIINTKKESM